MKLNKIYFILILLISTVAALIFFKLIVSNEFKKNDTDASKKMQEPELVKNYTIETNFINIEALVYKYSKDQTVIGAVKDKPYLFVADRFKNKIEKISLEKDSIIKKIDKYEFKPKTNEKLIILDLHADKDFLWASIINYSDNFNFCATTEIVEFDHEFNFVRNIFKSIPCIGGIGSWTEIAGRLTSNEDSIFISGGNIFLDLFANSYPRPGFCCSNEMSYEQKLESTNLYGSIVSINRKTLQNYKLDKGHRGPQGLYFDKNRNLLFSTEHGPRGGDELNIIKSNKDYGWPYASLGRPYLDDQYKILNNLLHPLPKYNNHTGYEEPVFAFVPSIGISQLTSIERTNSFFNYWSNDLLVSSLKDLSIYRLKLNNNNNILYSERIYIGDRIRDIEATNDIIISTDNGLLLLIKPTDKKVVQGPYPPLGHLIPLENLKNK